MTDTPSTPSSSPSPEAATGPVTTPPPTTTTHQPTYQHVAPPAYAPQAEQPRHNRLNVVAAWVGIVAGVVFIVTLIFGTGYVLGMHAGGHHGGRGPDSMMMQRGAPPQPPLLFPMGPRAQQERPFPPGLLPGVGPGLQPQQPQPGGPASTAPARP